MALCAIFALCALAEGSTMPSFDGGSAWFDSPPLQPSALRGKVVLVDFWEYTCLNCLRTLPYLREWYKRYHDDGFTIVGVQSPEFDFSGQPKNVEEGAKQLGITWPVIVDPNHTIWSRYGVEVWPTEMLFDQQGRLVDVNTGEGNYQLTESKIQALLRAGNPSLALPPLMALLPQDNYDKPGAVCYPMTPEILTGRAPIADAPSFGNPATDLDYADRGGNHRDGAVYLDGYWHANPEGVFFGGGGGYFELEYHAIQVSVVMSPGRGPSRVDVSEDGAPVPREDAGADLQYDASGKSYVLVDAPRAYDLIMNKNFGHHDLRLSPQGYDVGIYDIAFESCEVPGAAK
ncbi:MAG TPA: redoxin family protein [Candidatus Baltobacteraceae bacterium]|nr:redoxin family protein [Candidatus Baltobacteraceae bacterium]